MQAMPEFGAAASSAGAGFDVKAAEAFVCAVRDRSRVPGISIAVGMPGSLQSISVGHAALQPAIAMSDKARFQLGCIVNLLTSIVALRLAVSATFDLHAPIGTYLPELSAMAKGRVLTAWHLLSH